MTSLSKRRYWDKLPPKISPPPPFVICCFYFYSEPSLTALSIKKFKLGGFMKVISYYLRKIDLEGVDAIGLYKTLRSIGYICEIGNGLTVKTIVNPYESKEHVLKELVLNLLPSPTSLAGR